MAKSLDARIVAWNRTTAPYPHDRCIHELVLAQAARAPEALAVDAGATRWTYRQLVERATALAGRLAALGLGPGDIVAVWGDRTPDVVARVLGVLVAGAAYLPLDAHHPRARHERMIDDAGAAFIVGPHAIGAARCVGEAAADTRAPRPATPDELAYVIYTSGSTGTPKGILVPHRGVVNNLHDLNTRFSVGAGDRVLAVSSLGFDMSVYELLGTLCAGATVVLPETERAGDPVEHGRCVMAGVTVWNSAPALLGALVDHAEAAGLRFPSLRLALLGGDWVPLALPGRLLARAPDVRVVVMGGATEASIHSTIHVVGAIEPAWRSIPYGAPMANQRTYVLDEAQAPVPVGEPGELYLAGVGLCRGYLNRPDETAARFLPDPVYPGERMYRTGDRVRWREDGELELLGRVDQQVKIRGVRVELGEVEAVIARHPSVRATAAVATGVPPGERTLRVAVELRAPLDEAELRRWAAEQLPDAMVPSEILILDALPLSPNGKVDRLRLAALERPRTPATRAPSTPLEGFLAAAFGQLLGVAEVGADADFFALGGHSLLLLQLAARVQLAYGVRLSLRTLFNTSTVEKLAAHLEPLLGPAAERR